MESDSRESSTRSQRGVDANNTNEKYVGYVGPSERILLQQLEDLELRRLALEEQMATLETHMANLQERLPEVAGEIAAKERQKAGLAMDMYHVMEQMRDLESAKATVTEQKANVMEQMRELDGAMLDLERAKTNVMEQKTNIMEQMLDLERAMRDLESAKTNVMEQRANVMEQMRELDGAMLDLERAMRDLESAKANVMEQMLDLERAKTNVMEQRANVMEQRANIVEQMRGLDRAKDAFSSEFHRCEDLSLFLRILDSFGIELAPSDHPIWLKANSSSPDIKFKRQRQEEAESKSKSVNSTTWQLSKFNIHRCAGTASMFDVREWNISDDRMFGLVKQKLFGGDDAAANLLVSDCTKAVNQLRAFFAWLVDRNRKVAEVLCYPVLKLLLEYIIRSFPSQKSRERPEIEVRLGNEMPLEGQVHRQNSAEVTLRGTADLVVVRSGPDSTSEYNSLLFHVEVKSPTSDSANAKHQLVGQSEVIAQMREDRRPVFGCYTNMWKMAVSLRLPGVTEEHFDRVFYNTQSVVDSRQYSIRLLFLFCEFIPGELLDLTRDSLATDSEVLGSKQDDHSFEGDNDNAHCENDSEKPPTTTPPQQPTAENPPNQMKRNYTNLNDDSDEENEIFWEQLRKISEWEAHRRGHSYLCQENLDTLPHKSVGLRGELV